MILIQVKIYYPFYVYGKMGQEDLFNNKIYSDSWKCCDDGHHLPEDAGY